MKRFLAVIGAMGLLVGSALTAKADGIIPLADSGPIPACGNITSGSGTYAGGVMRLEVQLASAVCDGSSATASYDLYVILDKPSGAVLPDPADPFSFDVGPASQPQFLTSSYVEGDVNGAVTLTYQETILDDDDPNICVFSVVHGTVPVTTSTTDEGDHNGNGNTNDDKHRGNEGDNSEGDKHDWDETPTTTNVDYVDRAPATVDNVDPLHCFWLNAVSEAYFAAQEGSPSRGFN